MPRSSPYTILLSTDEEARLRRMASRYTSPYRDVIRAKVVLLAAEGLGNDEIGHRLDLPRQVASKWRKRFFYERLNGLCDRPRGGRPGVFPPTVVVKNKALACELPAELGLPLSRLSCADVGRAAVARGIVASISGTTVWRWLSADAIRPWPYRGWVSPRDPYFAERAGRVIDLYQGSREKRPLAANDYVICADEETSI